MYNDTIFTVADNKIVPLCLINLGKYRLPNELRPEPPQSAIKFRKGNERQYYFFASAMQSGEIIFLTTENYTANIDKYVLFSRNTNQGSLLVNESNELSGIINDWDGGPEFWPEGNINDNEIFMAIPPLTLKAMLKEKDFNNKTVKFQDKKQTLKLMVEKVVESDNPVLMVVKLKEKALNI